MGILRSALLGAGDAAAGAASAGCWTLRGRGGSKTPAAKPYSPPRWTPLGFDAQPPASPASPATPRRRTVSAGGGGGGRRTRGFRRHVLRTIRDASRILNQLGVYHVLYYDLATNIEYALQALELRGVRPDHFQLWAKTARDEAPYPLVGHERPFAIKLSCLRDALATDEGFDLDHCNSPRGPLFAHCQFILRSKRKASDAGAALDGKKSGGLGKKSRKSPMRIRQVFRRSASKDNVDGAVPGNPTSSPPGALFGIPLSRLIVGDTPPRPVMAMLQQVAEQGPSTQGIFRRSANARLVRELRDRLDAGGDNATRALEGVPVLVTAALLKDFLRSLPDPLLCARLYPLWMEALDCPDEQERLARVKSVLDQLPRTHLVLLQLFMCVLHLVARRAQHNLMTPANLGVCVGPSLLRPPPGAAPPAPLSSAASRAVPALVELLVARCELLLGPHVPHLLGHDGSPTANAPGAGGPGNGTGSAPNGTGPSDVARGDSGAEESDSLHSSGLRRDDSSIDSLERELLEPGHLPPPRKDKMSLSRDSGLTMSDSQLYTPDEEESSSSSSAGSGRGLYPPPQASQPLSSTGNLSGQPQTYELHPHAKVTSSYSVPNSGCDPSNGLGISSGPREYVRVYGGWEERVADCCREDSVYARPSRLLQQAQQQQQQNQHQPLNPNFQREHWFRQRSHLKRVSSGGSGGKAGSGKME
ncbi:Rho GTPase-activating protein 68F [Gryllus bimaculatus]|nr:Rho GTPase-activating protein 68F [Gryllus bimaculatus]